MGSVELCLALLDAGVEQPLSAVVADRTPRALAPATTVWVDVRAADAASRRMSFAPESNVHVALAPTSDELARIGPEHRTFAYRDGRWTPGAPPSLRREQVVIPLAAPGGVLGGMDWDPTAYTPTRSPYHCRCLSLRTALFTLHVRGPRPVAITGGRRGLAPPARLKVQLFISGASPSSASPVLATGSRAGRSHCVPDPPLCF